MKKRICFGFFASLLVFAIILASCASAPGGKRPGWVDTPPEDTGAAFFFVGAGSDPAGNEASARELAGAQLLSEITRFLGVKITSDTTVEARDAYGKFESNVTQILREQSAAQIGDLRIRDSYTEKDAAGISVFLLAEYDRKALLEEKARIEAVFAEQAEAISGPEREGDNLMARKDFHKAALRYIEAAQAASSSTVDNAAIKFERNINKAKEAVSAIRLVPLSGDLEGFRGERLDGPFRLLVTGDASGNPPGLAGVDIRILYKTLKRNGDLGLVTAAGKTGATGELEFILPPPNFTGPEKVTMSLDMGGAMEPLSLLPRQYQDMVEGLEQVIALKRTEFLYTVNSRATLVPTALYISDLDRNRMPLGRADTAAGALEVLSGSGFKVTALPSDGSLTGLADQALIARIRGAYGSSYSRVLYGSAEISGFEEADGAYLIRVSGSLKALDLATGQVLYAANRTGQARGRSESATISAAFKSLGKSLAEDMRNNLP